MDIWGTYTKERKNVRTGETTTDTAYLQADPINRQRYERKGFVFGEYGPPPGVGPAIQACRTGTAAEQIFGFLPVNGEMTELDDNEIVKQAAEVALRKITGTWTQAEAVAEEAAHARGEYKPRETPYAIVQGDILEGFDALTDNGQPSEGSPSPGPRPLPGVDGSGTPSPAPAP